jgi:transcriptional regulator with XRE-family HTH domain
METIHNGDCMQSVDKVKKKIHKESILFDSTRAALIRLFEESGLTQREISRRTGLSASTINSFLTGKRNLKTKWIPVICKALGVSEAQLHRVGGPANELVERLGNITIEQAEHLGRALEVIKRQDMVSKALILNIEIFSRIDEKNCKEAETSRT